MCAALSMRKSTKEILSCVSLLKDPLCWDVVSFSYWTQYEIYQCVRYSGPVTEVRVKLSLQHAMKEYERLEV